MLVFSAITPHTTLLIPMIGKENLHTLEATVNAMKHLAENAYLSACETLIVLSSHATAHQEAFSVNLHDEYIVDFKDFGDLSTTQTVYPDLELIATIQQCMRDQNIPVTLDSDASLDYGTGVPLFYLNSGSDSMRVVPIAYCGLSSRDHVRFGTVLKNVIDASSKRIGVIASGDLSHSLSSKAPLGFRPEGQFYDDRVLEAVKNHSLATLLNIDENWLTQSGQCLHEQLLMLFGVLDKKSTRPEILCYEAPFGVGYLVAQFHML